MKLPIFLKKKIILFGSFAYGQPQFHSDIDLLVVTNRHRRKSVFARDRLVAKVARPPGVAMDVIVRSPAELAYRLKIGDPFFFRVSINDITFSGVGKRQLVNPRFSPQGQIRDFLILIFVDADDNRAAF